MRTCPLMLLVASDPAAAGGRVKCLGKDCAWWTEVRDARGYIAAERCAVPLMAVGAIRRVCAFGTIADELQDVVTEE